MTKPELLKVSPLVDLFIQQYERYLPTAFDESMTILQKLNKVIWQLGKLTELSNEMIEKWNEVIDWLINEGLEQAVLDQLEKWLEDGTLADLIADGLLDGINAKMEQLILDMAKLKEDLGKTGIASANLVYQKKLVELNVGFGATQIFTGAENASQGMAYATVGGVEKLFMLHRVTGTAWKTDERQRITEFDLKEDGSIQNAVSYSAELNLGHQGLSAFVEDGKLFLYAGMNTGADDNAVKGYSKIEWKGSATTQANVQSFQVFGLVGSGHYGADYSRATTAVSKDGMFIIMCTWDIHPQNTRWMFIYDRKQIEGASDPLTVNPLNRFKVQPPKVRGGHIVQGLACDNRYIYVFGSEVEPKTNNVINVFAMSGYQFGWFHVDGSVGEYTNSQLASNGSLGTATQMEAEGIAMRDNGNIIFLTTDVWQNGSTYTRRSKLLFELTNLPSDRTKSINRGYVYRESPAPLHLYEGTYDVTINKGDAITFGAYDENTFDIREMFGYHSENNFQLFDVRDGSKNTIPANFYVFREGNRSYFSFRAKTNNTDGAGFNAYSADDEGGINSAGHFIIYSNSRDGSNGGTWDVRLQETGNWRPSTNGIQSMGTASYRWNALYASTGTINTSDRNAKQQIGAIPDEVLDAWEEVEFVQYKFNQSVEEKGENARFHVGVIAQQIAEVFEAHGLNAFEYGILCVDDDEIDPTIKHWAVRYDEAQNMEMALMRRELKRLRG